MMELVHTYASDVSITFEGYWLLRMGLIYNLKYHSLHKKRCYASNHNHFFEKSKLVAPHLIL